MPAKRHSRCWLLVRELVDLCRDSLYIQCPLQFLTVTFLLTLKNPPARGRTYAQKLFLQSFAAETSEDQGNSTAICPRSLPLPKSEALRHCSSSWCLDIPGRAAEEQQRRVARTARTPRACLKDPCAQVDTDLPAAAYHERLVQRPEYCECCVRVSTHGASRDRPQNTVILVKGTPKKGPLMAGNHHMG